MAAPLRCLRQDDSRRSDRPGRHRRSGFLSGELHKRENAGILSLLRTAVLRGLRPTTLLLRKQPYSKWNDLDRTLLQAFQIYEDEIVRNSGMPYWLTRNLDPEIQFVVETRLDAADEALDKWDQENSGKKKKPGVSRYVVAVDADGQPFEYGGLTRQQFSEAAIQEEQDRADGIEIERDRPQTGYNPADYGDGVTDTA